MIKGAAERIHDDFPWGESGQQVSTNECFREEL